MPGDPLGSLPLDAFLTICAHISVLECEGLYATSRTCYTQTQTVYDRVKSFSFVSIRNWSDGKTLRLIARFKALEKLSLKKNWNFQRFTVLPSVCAPSLTTLSLAECQICDSELEQLLQWLPQLQTLDLSRTSITDEGLFYLRKALNLRSLSLVLCPGITSAGIGQLLKHSALRSISLRGTNMKNMLGLAISSSTLDSMNLSQCRSLGNFRIPLPAPRHLLNLRSITLTGCLGLGKVCLELPGLENLSLGGSKYITLLDLSHCLRLSVLDISGCGTLETLRLASKTRLRTVSLYGCRSLPLSALLGLARASPSVERINCQALIQLTDAVLQEMLLRCPLLATLELVGCRVLSEVCIARAQQTCRLRKHVLPQFADLSLSPAVT